jgi:hypothetical protein
MRKLKYYEKMFDGKIYETSGGSTYRDKRSAEIKKRQIKRRGNRARIVAEGPRGPYTIYTRSGTRD